MNDLTAPAPVAAPPAAPAAPAAPPAAAAPPPAGNQPAAPGAPAAAPPAGDPQLSAVPDWRAGITDAEQLEFAKRIASPADAVKVALDLRKANGSMIRVPGKDAKPEDVAKFNKAIGVPDKPEEYKFDIGREPTDADKAVQGALAKVMHANGIPATAATALSKAVTELAQAQTQEADRVATQARATAQAALDKEWGADKAANYTVAKQAIQVFGNADLVSVLETATVNGQKLGDHPAMIKAFAAVGRRMGEGAFIGAVGATERQGVQDKINSILAANPVGSEKYKNPAVQRELAGLYENLHGTAAVGRGAA